MKIWVYIKYYQMYLYVYGALNLLNIYCQTRFANVIWNNRPHYSFKQVTSLMLKFLPRRVMTPLCWLTRNSLSISVNDGSEPSKGQLWLHLSIVNDCGFALQMTQLCVSLRNCSFLLLLPQLRGAEAWGKEQARLQLVINARMVLFIYLFV